MANRFPLIVNPATKKIEELASGDSIDLTSSSIYASGSVGIAGQFLKSTGTTVEWANTGDVFLNTAQTLSNKTFVNSIISGLNNSISNIPNSSLVNSGITINGQLVELGDSFSVPVDTNTTYAISLTDGADATRKIIRLTGTNPSSTDDVTLKAGQNVTISRINDEITFNSSYVDTITRIQGEAGGTPTSGDIVFLGTGSTTVSQSGQSITINSFYVDTITRLKGEAGGTFQSGDVTFLQGGATTITQSGNNITVSSQDTITRLKGGASGVFLSGDITFTGSDATNVTQSGDVITIDSTNTVTRVSGGLSGNPVTGDVRILTGGASSVAQSGNDITITSVDTITRLRGGTGEQLASGDFTIVGAGAAAVTQSGNTITVTGTDTNTVTRVQGPIANGGTLLSGDITITGAGAASVSQSGSTITVTSTDTDTTYSAGIGLALNGTVFSLKNQDSLTNNRLLKWNTSNGQLVNSNIADDGSTITITGNLNVTGTTTTVNTATLTVNDAEIELRTGSNIIPANGGIQINRTTDGTGTVTAYQSLQWFESGGYWRSFNGTVSNRFVTENETQTLTNKTLTSPILSSPTLGIATATTLNKVTITAPATGSTLTINEGKALTVSNSVSFSGTDNSSVNFGGGGTIAYISNKLSAFAATSSDELRGVISDETGTGKLVFASNPEFTTSITSASTTFNVFNTTVSAINAFGAATAITIGATSGDTTIRNNLAVNGNVTLSNDIADTVTVNGTTTFNNEDVTIRGIRVGRGASGVDTNTAFGKESLRLVVGIGAGNQNTALGYETLYSNNTGSRNVAVGFRAGRTITSGMDNVTVGHDALYTNTVGNKNVAIGAQAMYSNVIGTHNVVIGYNAGWGITGSGNVVIGPAQNGNSSDATYQLPNPTGSNQLVIASGAGTWIRGDNVFDVTIPNNLGVSGNLTIAGSTTNVNSRILSVKASNVSFVDKDLLLGNVTTTTFTAIVQQGQTAITLTSFGTGIIPGMVVVSQTDGITVPANTTIVSIDEANSTAVLSAAPNLGTGSVTFQATGPSNTSADGGGIRLKGTTDKSFTWSNSSTAWQSNQNLDLVAGLAYKINNVSVLNSTTLGANVVNSSLTSLGTLTSLTIANSGTSVGLTITNTGTGDCLVINDEASDTTPFKIDNAGTVYITGNISDVNASTGTTNQVLARKGGGGVEWKGLNTLADPNTVTNAGTSTDNAIARFDLETGKIIQNSGITIDDSNILSTPGSISSSFSTTGSAALTLTNDAATGLANNAFSISTSVKGGIHFGNAAGTGGAARQAAITFRGNSTDQAQAGIYVINNNTIGTAMAFATTDNYTTGPQQALTISHTGAVTINRSSLTVSGNLTVDTNTLFVDATNNRVHIGEAGTALANLNISGTGGQGGGIQINRNTTGNPTSGQSLGSIAFKGVTSANSNAAGEVLIEAIASENHSGSTAGTELAIYTKPSGTGPGSSPTKRVTVSSAGDFKIENGNLVIGTSGKGIDFSAAGNASGMTSELLDDYEVGTWTPTLSSGGWGGTPTVNYAKYVKIGKKVFVTFYWDILTGTGDGTSFVVDGLPFTSEGSNHYGVGTVDFGKGGIKGTYARVGSNTNTIDFYYPSENTNNSRVQLTGNQVGDSYVICSVTYLTA